MLVYYFVPFIVSNRYLLFWVSNGHNSINVQNRTHVYMNFFDHKDLGNHLLQLCPKVVKHPVYWNRFFNQLMFDPHRDRELAWIFNNVSAWMQITVLFVYCFLVPFLYCLWNASPLIVNKVSVVAAIFLDELPGTPYCCRPPELPGSKLGCFFLPEHPVSKSAHFTWLCRTAACKYMFLST